MTMRQVTGNMASVVKGMDRAMDTMNLERVRSSPSSSLDACALTSLVCESLFDAQISMVMDKFEAQFTDLDVQTSYMEDTMSATTAISTPQDQIDALLRQTAEEANIELAQDLDAKALNVSDVTPPTTLKDEDDKLADRLRALRPAT